MKDGKCWDKTDRATSVQWTKASGYCAAPWHLPSQQEFDKLLLAYYPGATAASPGHYYNGSTSAFAADWGATAGYWWSSTPDPSTTIYVYFLRLDSSGIYSYGAYNKARDYQVRCVSEV